jgi:hypothetical protein
MRYVVIDTNWVRSSETLPCWPGSVLGRFNTLDSAKALVLQRMAYGDEGVVVVDSASGRQAYPIESPLARLAV